MAKINKRSYSHYTLDAVELFAVLIKSTRIENKITMTELAEKANISRSMLRRIENADPVCGIGVVFEVAKLLGIQLFQLDDVSLKNKKKDVRENLALLPGRVNTIKIEVDDDF